MDLKSCKKKYFIITEGEDRAIIRDTSGQAVKKKKKLEKFSKGKKVHIYVAELKEV